MIVYLPIFLFYSEKNGWIGSEFLEECLDGLQSRDTQVMLHPLHIALDFGRGNPKKAKKISQNPVALGDFLCDPLSLRSEYQPTVLFMPDKALRIKALHHVGDACLGNPQAPSDVNHTGIPFGFD